MMNASDDLATAFFPTENMVHVTIFSLGHLDSQLKSYSDHAYAGERGVRVLKKNAPRREWRTRPSFLPHNTSATIFLTIQQNIYKIFSRHYPQPTAVSSPIHHWRHYCLLQLQVIYRYDFMLGPYFKMQNEIEPCPFIKIGKCQDGNAGKVTDETGLCHMCIWTHPYIMDQHAREADDKELERLVLNSRYKDLEASVEGAFSCITRQPGYWLWEMEWFRTFEPATLTPYCEWTEGPATICDNCRPQIKDFDKYFFADGDLKFKCALADPRYTGHPWYRRWKPADNCTDNAEEGKVCMNCRIRLEHSWITTSPVTSMEESRQNALKLADKRLFDRYFTIWEVTPYDPIRSFV
ncbi:hypothetical protein BDV95DRAFT_214449 [Massariosphaeria phaeospora]|uniref:Uncharacterized protein n=1 Tax=Massariosphaeria phaeospora TaxID=100035 RepID=A0A7C8I683_9PLEO|nr:hypothetical protein BDV95DRAFT_214449 [Massariosphaeria phaeospora]